MILSAVRKPKIIHPGNESTWYVAVGPGWCLEDRQCGVTWTPIFDDQPSYSIGCVTIDPVNPHTIWVMPVRTWEAGAPWTGS